MAAIDPKQFCTVIDAIPAGIIVVDRHGGIVFTNSHTTKMLGYTPNDLIGQSVEVVLRSDIVESSPADNSNDTSSNGRLLPSQGEIDAIRKNGSECPAEIAVNA